MSCVNSPVWWWWCNGVRRFLFMFWKTQHGHLHLLHLIRASSSMVILHVTKQKSSQTGFMNMTMSSVYFPQVTSESCDFGMRYSGRFLSTNVLLTKKDVIMSTRNQNLKDNVEYMPWRIERHGEWIFVVIQSSRLFCVLGNIARGTKRLGADFKNRHKYFNTTTQCKVKMHFFVNKKEEQESGHCEYFFSLTELYCKQIKCYFHIADDIGN